MSWNPPPPMTSAPPPMTSAPPPMGWHPTADAELRWWNGRTWTGMRLRGGEPGADWAIIEPPGLALALGFLWLVMGCSQLALGFVSRPTGLVFLATTVFWFAIAANTYRLRRAPVPSVPPVAPESVRPLPWEQEGPGAGWYPMTAQVTRWWTGTRWGQYTASKLGVYPTFHGARSYRLLRGVSLGVLVLGVLLLVGGIALTDGVWPALEWMGGLAVIAGVIVLVPRIFLVALVTPMQRRTLLLPSGPPAAWTR